MRIKYTKKIILIVLILSITIILLLFNLLRKECLITGYAYKNEIIKIILVNKKVNIVPYRDKESSSLCFINERVKYCQVLSSLRLKLQIDSSGIILLDTVLILHRNIRKPLISIEAPQNNRHRRGVFLLNDRNLIKP